MTVDVMRMAAEEGILVIYTLIRVIWSTPVNDTERTLLFRQQKEEEEG